VQWPIWQTQGTFSFVFSVFKLPKALPALPNPKYSLSSPKNTAGYLLDADAVADLASTRDILFFIRCF